MILVHPPVAKPGEPPAGIARLSGMLNSHDIAHTVVDANLEALLFIINGTRRNKLISKILNNDPPFFTSNHAPFFVMKK